MVRNCLEESGAENGDAGDSFTRRSGRHRSLAPLERETPFVHPVIRLANWSGFSATLIISHIAEASNAGNLYRACGLLADRCREVREGLITRFPELESADVQHNQR
jgi:hypothetical protein